MSSIDVRQRITDAILDHEYDGDGKCRCGKAVGWSDGVVFETHMPEHIADAAYWSLFDGNLLGEEAI